MRHFWTATEAYKGKFSTACNRVIGSLISFRHRRLSSRGGRTTTKQGEQPCTGLRKLFVRPAIDQTASRSHLGHLTLQNKELPRARHLHTGPAPAYDGTSTAYVYKQVWILLMLSTSMRHSTSGLISNAILCSKDSVPPGERRRKEGGSLGHSNGRRRVRDDVDPSLAAQNSKRCSPEFSG